jgi:hypothetical protein
MARMMEDGLCLERSFGGAGVAVGGVVGVSESTVVGGPGGVDGEPRLAGVEESGGAEMESEEKVVVGLYVGGGGGDLVRYS